MASRLPKVQVKTEYTRFYGGLDLETPALSIDPGALIAGMNYMCGTEGGYSRIDGYERYDGQAAPSDAVYYRCPCTVTDGGPSVGDTITGADSGETGEVIVVGADYICITKQSADFNDDEVYTVGGVAKGTFTAAQVENGETTGLLHVTALNLAADVYRDDIAAPTGSGAIRGLVLLDGTLYCFRDNAGGTAGLIYKATSSGWSAITPGNELSFGSGTGLIADGDTITGATSGATAVVARVVLESGTWGTDAAGRLIIGAVTGGPFQNPENLTVSGVEAATTSLVTAITISAGGTYDFAVYNFTGSTDTKRIYGCDGVNRGFEFDGTTYVPIDTGMTTDTPEHVAAYKEQLFFSFKGSSQNSGIGTPYVWSAVLGAAEIAIGDNITGYMSTAKALVIFSRNSTHQLTGNDVTDFVLDVVSAETGGIEWTMQNIGKSYALDDRGLTELTRAEAYGNFEFATVSRRVQARMDEMRSVAVASAVYRSKNQYRVYGNDGTGICATIAQTKSRLGVAGLVYFYTQFKYPDNVACTVSGEDSTGKDVVFFGSDVGMVYQADKGSSFDGDDIEAYLFLPFNNSKAPSVLKTYRKGTIEMTAEKYASLQNNVIFSYGDSSLEAHSAITNAITGGGGRWDLANWDEFFYDSDVVAMPSFTLAGDGVNLSMFIYSKTDIDLGHKLDGAYIHFTPRRLVR